MTAIRAYMWSMAGEKGVIVCGREFMNSLDESSMAEVKAAIESEPWLADHFEVGEKFIRTRDGRIEYKFIGLRHNLDSIKSKARIKLCWVDEAEPVSETAWQKIIPSVREHESEIWVTWNPESKVSATHKRFRLDPPDGAKIIEMNYTDNPWFPLVLEKERLADQSKRPEHYEHIWEGGFKQVTEGAYYAAALTQARNEGRIGRVAADPLMTIRLFADIGGTGARADSFVFGAAQFIAREIRWLDHYEVQGQPIGAHLSWARSKGYTPERAQIWLPHDGASNDKVYDVSYASALREAGYEVTVVPNQGKGAASARIEAGRRLFPAMWFNEATTGGLIDALSAYHERKDPDRGIGLGPEHDWASHGADMFGLACVAYEEPKARKTDYSQLNSPPNAALRGLNGPSSGAWMGN